MEKHQNAYSQAAGKSQHEPGPAQRAGYGHATVPPQSHPGAALARGRGSAGPRLGPAATARGDGAPRSPIPTQPGNLREDLQRPRPRGWGSGSGLWSTVARGAGVCAACRGRATPSPACRPCLQSQAAPLPRRLPTNRRGNPWGHGHSRMGDRRGLGRQRGALEPDCEMLADLGGWQRPAKLCTGFVLSHTLWGPTNQSNTRVSSRRSCLGTFLVQGVGVPIAYPSIPH